jgi:hypothetical protein
VTPITAPPAGTWWIGAKRVLLSGARAFGQFPGQLDPPRTPQEGAMGDLSPGTPPSAGPPEHRLDSWKEIRL